MKAFFNALFEYLEAKVTNSFSDQGKYGSIYPTVTPLERFFIVVRSSLKRRVPLFITFLLVILVIFRVAIIYSNLRLQYSLANNINDLYYQNSSLKLLLSTISIILLSTLLIFVTWINRKNIKITQVATCIVLSVIAFASLTPNIKVFIERNILTQAIFRAEQLKYNNQFLEALEILQSITENSEDPETYYEVSKEIANINLEISDFKTSIESRAQLIALYPDRMTESDQIELHEAIYALGEVIGIQEAEVFLQEVENKYPVWDLNPFWLGAKGTSALWLGISPKNYAYILAGDVYSLGVETLEEEATLRELIIEFPDEPLADWGRLILGEHFYIVQNEPESKVRDWALYKAGVESYLEKDYESSINYFRQFLKEFPRHRWADDAGYRMSRSYELAGEYEKTLDELFLAQDYPDGNMDYVIEPYIIAIIDAYFDSSEIESYISRLTLSNQQRNIPLLKFCLGEQLIKEGNYIAAQSEFRKLIGTYPGTVEAQFANKNLNILKILVELDTLPYPDNIIGVSRFLINDSTDNFSESLIIYNELYLNNRLEAVANIGMYGPSWEYIASINDYLKAASLLEKFIESDPSHPRIPEALYLDLLAYYNLTFDVAFFPSSINSNSPFSGEAPPEYRISKAEYVGSRMQSISNKLLVNYPNYEYTPDALSLTAIGLANMDEHTNHYVNQITQFMLLILEQYPDHHLANNSAIYLARYYRQLAAKQFSSDLRDAYYDKSKEFYEITLDKYPSGHVGKEAYDELIELEKVR